MRGQENPGREIQMSWEYCNYFALAEVPERHRCLELHGKTLLQMGTEGTSKDHLQR